MFFWRCAPAEMELKVCKYVCNPLYTPVIHYTCPGTKFVLVICCAANYGLTYVCLFLHGFSYTYHQEPTQARANIQGRTQEGDYFGKGYATRLCVNLATAAGMDNAARCTTRIIASSSIQTQSKGSTRQDT